ncbi:MAG TPA: Crp/Fnr family transcriptional regulator [Methylocella sp.]
MLDQHLRSIDVRTGSVLCWADHAIDHAFFPDGAILSVLTVLADGSAIETAKIGREGAFGLFEAMYTHTSFNQCVVLLGGRLLRCPFGVLRFLLENNSEIRSLYICYTEALHAQSQQVAACSTLHSVRERLCRWLLTLHDRNDGQEFAITHEYVAHILGINRKSVTLTAQAMQNDGLISYHRGRMRILDRRRLERASCECYVTIERNFEAVWAKP